MFATDETAKMRSHRKSLEATLASGELERVTAEYDKAEAALQADVKQERDRRANSWGSSSGHATDVSHPAYVRRQQLQQERNDLGLKRQAVEREYGQARAELAKLSPMLDNAALIKDAKRKFADARIALRDLQDAVASHAQLIEEVPKEVDVLEQRRKDLIAAHAKTEATARAAKQPVPAFPGEVGRIAVEIESKRAVLAAAKEMHDQARDGLPDARQEVENARAALRNALHFKAQLEYTIKTADLGPVVAMLIATASPYDALARDRRAEVTTTPEALVAAEAQVAKEFA